jgi:5-methylcytosine-specific restriction enzyme B
MGYFTCARYYVNYLVFLTGLQPMTLTELLKAPHSELWNASAAETISALFEERYKQLSIKADLQLRTPKIEFENAPYAALINKNNPTTGAYGGISLVISPSQDGRSVLMGFCAGTNGIAPDEDILGLPGHMRFIRALSQELSSLDGVFAWHKADPTLVDEKQKVFKRTPDELMPFATFWKKYQHVMYSVVICQAEQIKQTEDTCLAMLDHCVELRGGVVKAAFTKQSNENLLRLKKRYFKSINAKEAGALLNTRRYLVLQGAPGTGKSHISQALLEDRYSGNGISIQFHPSFSYEQFVGGLSPIEKNGQFGFEARAGILMQAVKAANQTPEKPYLLHIDELNRADIARVLGESLYLLEPHSNRELKLAYDFGAPWGNSLTLPDNLHILCTMNTNDRSIASLDLAIRRRFAFATLWPQSDVVLAQTDDFISAAYTNLEDIFFESANEGSLALMPGQSYFLAPNATERLQKLHFELIPLLRHYLESGLLGECFEQIHAYIQWLES